VSNIQFSQNLSAAPIYTYTYKTMLQKMLDATMKITAAMLILLPEFIAGLALSKCVSIKYGNSVVSAVFKLVVHGPICLALRSTEV
jgi:hypothetical protein